MATPNHIPEMSFLDSLTVVLYRTGLSIFAVSTALHTIELLFGCVILGKWHLPVTAAGVALASADVHLYDPRFRWLFPLMSWLGLTVLAFTMQVESSLITKHMSMLSLSFFYAGAGMFAIKESFCFKIAGLSFVPFFLAMAILLHWGGFISGAGVMLIPAALLYLRMSYAKWAMPLHFDIGDKSQYQN